MKNKSIAILGAVGVPSNYGGFETLAENLVRYHDALSLPNLLTVYCSARRYKSREPFFLSSQLKYIHLNANGVQSILYDIISLLSAVWNRNEVILLLGVSGAIALPLVRVLSSSRIITNIDGIEWRRDKWQGLAKRYLRFSEELAVRLSHDVISDNYAIADYVKRVYGIDSHVIAYGGDHAVSVNSVAVDELALPRHYSLSVCRIEPENNIHMILEAFCGLESQILVMVGNWNCSEYGRMHRAQYQSCKNFYLIDPIYNLGKLKTLRSHCSFYIHGHSAGGTNPSLVEAMHFGMAILAFDCDYNRNTTENRALYFSNSNELKHLIKSLDYTIARRVGRAMIDIARRRYIWRAIAKQYFILFR